MIYLDVDGVIADFEAGLKVLGWTGNLCNRGDGNLSKFMYEHYEQVFTNCTTNIKCRLFYRSLSKRKSNL